MKLQSTCFDQLAQRLCARANVLVLGAIVAVCAGCGEGSGGGSADAVSGTAVVSVTDVLGDPVPGAYVEFSFRLGKTYEQIGRFADATGTATFSNIESRWPVNAYAWDRDKEAPGAQFGSSEQASLLANGRIDLSVTITPSGVPALVGVAPSSAVATEISPDGRVLEFSIGLLHSNWVYTNDYEYFRMRPCTPDPTNDATAYPIDCIAGGGSDAAYDAPDDNGNAVSVSGPAQEASGGPISVAILLDQSNHIAMNDPSDERIFAIKYFLTTLTPDDHFVLAAFASDDIASGQRSPLPQTPVTIFPAEDPRFATFDRSSFATVDSLTTLEGGTAPLYAAIDTMLDFTAAHEPSDRRRAVVVLTDGEDDTCLPADCARLRQTLIDKSRASGVAIITIGLANPFGPMGRETLSEFANGGAGAALWIDAADPVVASPGLGFGALRAVLDGTAPIYEARYRIESAAIGAFQSGRRVLGTLVSNGCGGDCDGTVYFSVPIP